MSKEMRILFWCDLCMPEDGDPTVPAQHNVTFGLVAAEERPVLRVLDVCDDCLGLVNKTVQPWQQVARPPEFRTQPSATPAPRPGNKVTTGDPHVCPKCQGEYGGRQALIKHVWRDHRGLAQPPQPEKCPSCKHIFSAQGMTMHRIMAHDYDQLAEALEGLV